MRDDLRYLRLDRGIDAADQRGAQLLTAPDHALQIEIRRNTDDALAPCVSAPPAAASPACAPGSAEIVACEARLSRRVRNSPSNPFITEMMVISAATPTQMPEHRDPADEGNEEAAAAAAHVTQADVQRQRDET